MSQLFGHKVNRYQTARAFNTPVGDGVPPVPSYGAARGLDHG